MNRANKEIMAIVIAGLTASTLPVHADQWSGNITLETRVFPQDALFPQQSDNNLSVSIEPQYYTDWDDGRQLFVFTPFARLDQHDSERTHADIRELTWIKVEDKWELSAGIRKVFWGVTESQHLVDIINQTDLVENSDGEDKLGQPMINFAWIDDWGTLDIFLLTGFRERTFPGEDGRFRGPLVVDIDNPIYQSSKEDKRIDSAARWYHTIDIWDIGVSYFYGTSRDPVLTVNSNATALLPRYDVIRQTGVDLQATLDEWLIKFEAIHRSGQDKPYNALTAGFEYTFFGIVETQYDLGVIMEYLHDDRDENSATPFENDLLIASRLTFNNAQSSEILFGIIQDLSSDERLFNLEASSRLGESWKLSLEARIFNNIKQTNPLFYFRNDDTLQMDIAWYF